MIEFVHGDIFATRADIRVNTVNCVGVMGAGVALAFKQRYPDMFKEYQHACKDGLVRPGKLHVWRSLEGDWVINFPTKRDWRDPSRYEDIDVGLNALHEYLLPLGNVSVALPALGCGHGGLEWERVSQMIEGKLSDLSADVRVFAPSDSRRAGHPTNEAPSQDELRAAEHLGYVRVSPTLSEGWKTDSAFFAKGRLKLLDRRWIALLPSRAPGERELHALGAVATELCARDRSVTVALVYGNRTSEEISEIFVSKGINVVMLLPFGVLTRKALARTAREDGIRSATLASAASPGAKWSRALFAQTMELLQARASTVLLSDPDLSWLTKRSESGWWKLPTFFLRYDTLAGDVRDVINHPNVSAIGRRPADSAPNLDGLLAALRSEPVPTEATTDARGDVDAVVPLSQASSDRPDAHSLHLDLQGFPEERWADVVNLIRQAGPRSVKLSVEIGNDATAMTLEERLSALKAHSKS